MAIGNRSRLYVHVVYVWRANRGPVEFGSSRCNSIETYRVADRTCVRPRLASAAAAAADEADSTLCARCNLMTSRVVFCRSSDWLTDCLSVEINQFCGSVREFADSCCDCRYGLLCDLTVAGFRRAITYMECFVVFAICAQTVGSR